MSLKNESAMVFHGNEQFLENENDENPKRNHDNEVQHMVTTICKMLQCETNSE